jgi:prepilin-type N-terminal cleavage/methylation domain-containing protein
MKCLKKTKGFTLTELIIVMAIMAILAAATIPSVNGIIANQARNSAKSNTEQIFKVMVLKMTEVRHYGITLANSEYMLNLTNLVQAQLLSDEPKIFYYVDDLNKSLDTSYEDDYVLLTVDTGAKTVSAEYFYYKSGTHTTYGFKYTQLVL